MNKFQKAKAEFERIRKWLKQKHGCRVFLHHKKPSFFKESERAMIFHGSKTIYVHKHSNYVVTMLDLLHEVGHLLDFENHGYLYVHMKDDCRISSNQPMTQTEKISLYMSEYYAERNALWAFIGLNIQMGVSYSQALVRSMDYLKNLCDFLCEDEPKDFGEMLNIQSPELCSLPDESFLRNLN
jgi:hypothetical protein